MPPPDVDFVKISRKENSFFCLFFLKSLKIDAAKLTPGGKASACRKDFFKYTYIFGTAKEQYTPFALRIAKQGLKFIILKQQRPFSMGNGIVVTVFQLSGRGDDLDGAVFEAPGRRKHQLRHCHDAGVADLFG